MVRSQQFMNRRELLQGIGLLLGGSISSPVMAAVLAPPNRAASDADWQPRTLSDAQNRLVTAIAEVIIPATDTPGAAAARVNVFIDLLLSDWLDRESVVRFLAGLEQLESRSRGETGKIFVDLSTSEQLRLLGPLDAAAVAYRRATNAPGSPSASTMPFFGMMKEMTLVGYYTSEVGMTQELRLPEITDAYRGCVPYEEVGRSWA
jgi:glucoside 3-dehydrogenase (cytochrome c) hitch-hiker subunit